MSDNKKNQEVRENNEVWEQSGLTEEEFNALSPERKASLAEEFHKAKQAEETYNWPKVAVQVLCTTILVGGLAIATARKPQSLKQIPPIIVFGTISMK